MKGISEPMHCSMGYSLSNYPLLQKIYYTNKWKYRIKC